jgi:hypothetical protein
VVCCGRWKISPTQSRKAALQEYRYKQRLLAIDRDGGWCAFHFFLKGEKVKRQEVHHVFGRGNRAGAWQEHYTQLLSTCRECHPLPVKSGSSPNLDYVKDVLDKANVAPINKDFVHPGEPDE